MILAILEDGPSLMRYWAPAGGTVPAELADAVEAFIDSSRDRLLPVSVSVQSGEATVFGYDFKSKKWRWLRLALRKERL